MGRRAKGKKQSTNTARDDAASGGEEGNIPVRRRGRPQKALKDEEEIEKIEEEDESENAKSYVWNKDMKKQPPAAENVRKRKKARPSPAKEENDDLVLVEDNGVGGKTDGLKGVGFRQNGSRRKNKPRRAAEVGVECK